MTQSIAGRTTTTLRHLLGTVIHSHKNILIKFQKLRAFVFTMPLPTHKHTHRQTDRQTDRQTHTHTHTHTFNGPFSGTTQVSRYKKGKTNLDFTEVRDSEWQWHRLGCMQVCTSLQTDNHASTSPLSFYRPDSLPAAQPTASKHWRQKVPLPR